MRRAVLAGFLVACSGGTVIIDGGVDATTDVIDDHVIGSPLDAAKDVADAAPDVVDATSDAKDSSVVDAAFDGDAADWPALVTYECDGGFSCAWTNNNGYPSNYECIQCLDTAGCGKLYPWNNGCGDAGTVYDPIISAFDGSSSIIKFCAPSDCQPF